MKWISVKDQLPKPKKWAIVFDKFDDVFCAYLKTETGVDPWEWITMYDTCCDPDKRYMDEILYWMPLPSKPQEIK